MIFNMSQCGLSNMDMDFIKFLITCFKCYYPSMLGETQIIDCLRTYCIDIGWLLVFEMPWILQGKSGSIILALKSADNSFSCLEDYQNVAE